MNFRHKQHAIPDDIRITSVDNKPDVLRIVNGSCPSVPGAELHKQSTIFLFGNSSLALPDEDKINHCHFNKRY